MGALEAAEATRAPIRSVVGKGKGSGFT